jgi:EpsI family protein
MRNARSFLPLAILLAGCALTWNARTQDATPLSGSLSTVLPQLSGYEVTEQQISAEEQRVAGMTNYVARVYQRSDSVAFTTLVSYYDKQAQGRTIHSPRNCLPGAGWEILSGDTRQIVVDGKTQTVNRYVLRNGTSAAIAYYWYQGRGRVTANEYLVKWNLLRDAALLGRSEEALVRVLVPIAPGDVATAGADVIADQVAPRLIAEVDRVLPKRSRS